MTQTRIQTLPPTQNRQTGPPGRFEEKELQKSEQRPGGERQALQADRKVNALFRKEI